MTRRASVPFAALALLCAPGAHAQTPRASSDSANAVATVEAFHDALARGDSAAAAHLLAPDVVVLEAGELETRAEYLAHHLPADIEFARALPSRRALAHVTMRGDAAWVTSTSRTEGEFRGRAIRSAGAELMVLARTPAGWRIAAIHWSSHALRP